MSHLVPKAIFFGKNLLTVWLKFDQHHTLVRLVILQN